MSAVLIQNDTEKGVPMARPTIRDLATAAGVSVATVNRVLGGSQKVREPTMRRVLEAAREIGFYGFGALQARIDQARPRDRFVVMLQQPGRLFYETVADHLRRAAAAIREREVDLVIEFMSDLSPDTIARRMQELGGDCDCLAVVAAEHPMISDAIVRLVETGTPVLALISPLSAPCGVGFVGLDSWKVGRSVGWCFERICRAPGKIGVLVGNHRYRNHTIQESGFRSYLREHDRGFVVLEPRSTYESTAIAREMTEKLLEEHPDLAGLYVCGGGITGALSAVRSTGRDGSLVVIGYDLFATTRAGLLDGSLTLVLSHPFVKLADETLSCLIRAKLSGEKATSETVLLEFDFYMRENI